MERVEQSQGLYQSENHEVNAKKKDTKKQIMALASVLTSLCLSESFSILCLFGVRRINHAIVPS